MLDGMAHMYRSSDLNWESGFTFAFLSIVMLAFTCCDITVFKEKGRFLIIL